jgi:hypothetical protein
MYPYKNPNTALFAVYNADEINDNGRKLDGTILSGAFDPVISLAPECSLKLSDETRETAT